MNDSVNVPKAWLEKIAGVLNKHGDDEAINELAFDLTMVAVASLVEKIDLWSENSQIYPPLGFWDDFENVKRLVDEWQQRHK